MSPNIFENWGSVWGDQVLHLLPTGSEERKVLGVESTPIETLSSCQDMENNAL